MSTESTIKDYLQGKIQGIELPESALRSICVDAGIEDMASYIDELTDRQKDLALAYAYIALSNSPTTSSRWAESDGDWSQSGGGTTYSAWQIREWVRRANAIFKLYGLPAVGGGEWGMRTGGIRNIRYRTGSRRTSW